MTTARGPLLALVLALGLLAAPQPAEAFFRIDSATRDQIRTILSDLRAQTTPLRDQVRAASTTLLDGIKAELALNDDETRAVRFRLAYADYRAWRAFRALPDADQTAANLSAAIQDEYAKVFADLTNDAAQLANLNALAQTYADAVAPIKLQIRALISDARAQIRALLSP